MVSMSGGFDSLTFFSSLLLFRALSIPPSLSFLPPSLAPARPPHAVPRSNLFVYFSPIHINVHQDSCLWLVEYVNGVIQTVNVELALTVKDEGKAFIVGQSTVVDHRSKYMYSREER